MHAMNQLEKIKEGSKIIKKEVKQKSAQYILIALAWNEMIKSAIEYLFPFPKNTILLKAIYAFLLTLLLVFLSLYLERLIEKK